MASKKNFSNLLEERKTANRKTDGTTTATDFLSQQTKGEKRKYTKRVPHENKDIVIHVRLTTDEYTAVNELAQRRNVSISQLTREELNSAVARLKRAGK